MTRADKLIHIRLDTENVKTAERRAQETDRGNTTAYINRLIREDGERNPNKKPKK